MEGHAGYGKEGADPLCGGLSVLAYTMAEFIGRLEAEGKLSEKPILSLSPGQAFLRAVAKKEFSQELHVGLTLIQGGFSLLAQSYPLWVELTVLENSGSLSYEEIPSALSESLTHREHQWCREHR
jgi:uncharacterized protein YsxB (DUF464 family)